MRKRFMASAVLLAAVAASLVYAQVARQPGAVYDFDDKDHKSAPAPPRDLSGVWEPANGPGDAIQATGAKAMPSDGKSEHALPLTPLGRRTLNSHKTAWGVAEVPAAQANDPVYTCDPQGFPRIVLHNFRTSQIVQTPNQVLILYEFNKIWRVIWTDGRPLPKDPDPRWWGYSVGKWISDDTFVAETVGLDDRTWLDNVGRPHSDQLRVEERYHRIDRDHLEMTITINDPKMYAKPWVALDKLRLRLQPANFDITEMQCVPSETAAYEKEIAKPADAPGTKKK